MKPELEAERFANLARWHRRRVIRIHDGLSRVQMATAHRVQDGRRAKARLGRFAQLVRNRLGRLCQKRCAAASDGAGPAVTLL